MATLQSTTINGSIEVPDGSTGSPAIVAAGDTDTGVFFPGDNSISFVTGGQVAMNINSSGYVTKPRHPLLNAGDSRALDLTGPVLDSTNFYNLTVYNQGSRLDASTGRFTAIVPGFYQATWWNNQSASGPNTNVRIRLNGTSNTGPLAEAWNQSGSAGCINVWVTCVIYLNVNDYIDVQVARLSANSAIQHKRIHIRFLG